MSDSFYVSCHQHGSLTEKSIIVSYLYCITVKSFWEIAQVELQSILCVRSNAVSVHVLNRKSIAAHL